MTKQELLRDKSYAWGDQVVQALPRNDVATVAGKTALVPERPWRQLPRRLSRQVGGGFYRQTQDRREEADDLFTGWIAGRIQILPTPARCV